MNSNQRHLVLVIGMHRCGTSVITRSLQSLGVELGNQLMPALANVNPKGYFEDLDFHSLNEQILTDLETTWDSLAAIPLEKLTGIIAAKHEAQALSLLKSRLETANLFAVKDPRFSKLLPFWKTIFKKLNLKVSYIISSRNPLSVGHSLAMRDNFTIERSSYLWLNYMSLSVFQTSDENRLFVDYDFLINDPSTELMRISNFLELNSDLNSPEILDYQNCFLESSLRHSCYTIEDLTAETNLPLIIIEFYKLLLKFANGSLNNNDHAILSKIEQDWLALAPSLCYSELLEQQLTKHTNTITELEYKLKLLSQEINKHKLLESQRELEIFNLQQQSQALNLKISEITASRSWQVTKPLRLTAESLRNAYSRKN